MNDSRGMSVNLREIESLNQALRIGIVATLLVLIAPTLGFAGEVITIDGTNFAVTATGIQSAINVVSASGGGKVILPLAGSLPDYEGDPITPIGNPIPMGNVTISLPSNVCLSARACMQTRFFVGAVPRQVRMMRASICPRERITHALRILRSISPQGQTEHPA